MDLAEFVRLKKEFEKESALTASQLFALIVGGIFVILLLGFVSSLFGGPLFGPIIASVISTVLILGGLENMRNWNAESLLSKISENDSDQAEA